MGRVLIACEESQTVCKAFRELGHEAYSNDILQCSGGHWEWHLTGDAVEQLYRFEWDLVIAHPPCTYLCNSGVRWFNDPRHPDRWSKLRDAINFFKAFQKYAERGCKVAIENPIPHKFARDGFTDCATDWKFIPGIGTYTQTIQPYQFGHGEKKATCLWLYNLPELLPTNIVEGREQRIWKLPPSADRGKLRSKTYEGIAKAMAEQWGKLL